jgi:voltage-dependent calcium channel L type alpha-1D
VFALEAVVKIFAFGLLIPNDMHFDAYLQDSWNRVDFAVLCMSLLDLAGAGKYLGSQFTSIIKISRAFRPILLLRNNHEMRNVIEAFIGSAKPIAYALLFITLVITMFATMGMALFKGKFHSCNDRSLDGLVGQGKRECIGSMMDGKGIYMPKAWTLPASNFDSFTVSVKTLCKCLSVKWVHAFHLSSDVVAQDVQPVLLHSLNIAVVYFVPLIVMGSFIALSFFVSFVVDGFYSAQGQSGEERTEEIYYEWIQKQLLIHWPGEDVEPPNHWFRNKVRFTVDSPIFQKFSAACVLANVIFISCSHEGEAQEFSDLIEMQNNLFLAIMISEMLLNLVGHGIQNFWKNGYNRFDVLIIVITLVCLIFQENLRIISQMMRSLRLARFSKTLLKNKLISAMFDTVALSLKQVLPILCVLGLCMSIYAVIAVTFFGNIRLGVRLGIQSNFQNFGSAFRTLFQIMFGDEWHELMEDCALQPPFCTSHFVARDGRVLSYGDCGVAYSPLFFVSFKVLCEYTILNLFVGLILNNFSFCADADRRRTVITEKDIERFAHIWVREADRRSTGTIPMDFIYKLMFRIGAPLGMYETRQNIGRFLCVREDVRRRVEKLDSETNYGPFIRFFRWLVQLEIIQYEEALVGWKEMHKLAKKYERELKERDLSQIKASYEDPSPSNSEDDGEEEPGEEKDDGIISGDEDGLVAGKDFGGNIAHVEWGSVQHGDSVSTPSCRNPANLHFMHGPSSPTLPGCLQGDMERGPARGGACEGDGREGAVQWVSGRQMGHGGAPKNRGRPKGKVKKVKKQGQGVYDPSVASIIARRESKKASNCLPT